MKNYIANFSVFVNEGAVTDMRTQIESLEKQILDLPKEDEQYSLKKAGLKKQISQILDKIKETESSTENNDI
jgi:predicted  nucleic acid-binding Zn-ribbon protein